MAHLSQERHVELVAGARQLFSITNQVVDAVIPTQLPHLSVFVINVVDPLDPKQDTLARVANIADLTTIPQGREPGIASPGPDGTQYLSSSWRATYDTLETALNAAKAFRDRVNKLIIDWGSFQSNFNAPAPAPAVYEFPSPDTSTKAALIAAYKVAKQDRYQKQLAKTAADAAFAAAQTNLSYKQGLAAGMLAIASATTTNQSEMSGLGGFLATLQSAGATFAGANPGASGIATFQAALNAAIAQGALAITYASDASSLAFLVSLFLADRQGDVTAAATALAAAASDQLLATQSLTAALALETSALAAVRAVCPDFDKHSIPFVDDVEP